MAKSVDIGECTLYQGDCLDVLQELPENSVDSVICDPPYGLGFLSMAWDTFQQEYLNKRRESDKKRQPRTDGRKVVAWGNAADAGAYDYSRNNEFQEWCYTWARECLRVAKPGAMLVAFGGTRTSHRLTCAVEDAGWQIRDTLMWVYGSGFPKSYDISKGIDRAAGAKRRVVGVAGKSGSKRHSMAGDFAGGEYMSTAPATDVAKLWSGWGTALKPHYEPIVLAMKPLDGTYAQNAEKWGVAGLAIDSTRIETTDLRSGGFGKGKRPWQMGDVGGNTQYVGSEQGRWPANVLLSHHPECVEGGVCYAECPVRMLDEQSGTSISVPSGYDWDNSNNNNPVHIAHNIKSGTHFNDTGGASRFFKVIEHDMCCVLCGLTMGQRHGIMNTTKKGELLCNAQSAKENLFPNEEDNSSVHIPVLEKILQDEGGKSGKLRESVHNVESISLPMQETTKSIARHNVPMTQDEKIARAVKSVGNLCDLCATAIARSLVAIKRGQDPDSELGKVSISEHKKRILYQSLVLCAENWGNIDTIPTIPNLKLWFGYVQNAMLNSTLINEMEIAHGPTRFSYQSKASSAERNAGLNGIPADTTDDGRQKPIDNAYQRGKTLRRNTHPTVKPIALMEWLCRLTSTPTGGIVLDPFMGSGTTGIAAHNTGRKFIGIEKDEEYFELACIRIKENTRQRMLKL